MTPAVIVAIISVTIAACSLGYTIYDKRRTRPVKIIRWSVFTDTSLVNLTPGQGLDKLSVQWDGKHVGHPRFVQVAIRNAGTVELKESDVAVKPYIDTESAKILTAQITLYTAGNAKGALVLPGKSTDTLIQAPAVLLNPDDRLLFTLLVDGTERNLRPVMQAAGFTFSSSETANPEFAQARKEPSVRLLMLTIVLLMVLLVMSVILIAGSIR